MVSVPETVSNFLSKVSFPVEDPSLLNVTFSKALIDSLSENVRIEHKTSNVRRGNFGGRWAMSVLLKKKVFMRTKAV